MNKINLFKNDIKTSINYSENGSITINVADNNTLLVVAGELDSNLKKLENLSGSKIFFRGNSIIIKGEKKSNKKVEEAIKMLINQFRQDGFVEVNDFTYLFNGSDKKEKPFDDKLHSIDELIKTPRKSIIPRTKNQKEYVKALKSNEIVIALGPAGTGKTFLAVAVALTMLVEKKIEKIILSRPAVEAGEKLGFLPGDIKEKVDPYLRPLFDALYDLFGYEKIQKKIDDGTIEIAPLAFMRGRTLKNSFAILDEAQNATSTQIKMFLTRIGENSRLVVNGDPSQIDLLSKSQSGLKSSQNILKDIKEISVVEFDHTDVIRHPLVTKIVKAYQKND
tara:strand:+ start:4944 stop:5948 length:1005 start_codon:yes stop_codon:yes gene_type:complete